MTKTNKTILNSLITENTSDSESIMIQELEAALQEASNYTADRLILNALTSKGSVNLEEAEFFKFFANKIIEEAAEDFVPDNLPQPEAEPEAGVSEPLTLTDAEGNVYTYTPEGGLVPQTNDDAGDGAGDVADDGADAGEGEVAPVGEVPVQESTEAVAGDSTDPVQESAEAEPVIEESTTPEVLELTESQMIVANLISNMKK